MFQKISVLGSGNWGLTVALLLAKKGKKVTVWGRNKTLLQEMTLNRTNFRYLAGIILPENIFFTSDFEEAVSDKELIILGVPSHALREVAEKIKNYKELSQTNFLDLAKGIENETLLRMSEVFLQTTNFPKENYAVLAGPNIAKEVALEIPTTSVVCSENLKLAKKIQHTLSTNYFRVYENNDLVGVELVSSLKNVIAIAAGISDGLGFGTNAKSALMTRGLAEITRLGTVLGARTETFSGLSGIGDLITTCISPNSRNRTLGEKIGNGETLEQALSEMTMVAEGVKTTKSAYELAQKFGIEMPITEAIYKILFEGKNPKHTVGELMLRNLKSEH
ncbi:NAD(P)-dependent glycerol-3-phosphate dehydrogenase [bacterium]|nr:NAD(P)-dependent glycerol-3-phosphate dehydrogenase [bacterium]